MRKRILALFLALVMCLSLLPTAAFAEDITTGDGDATGGTVVTDTPTDEDKGEDKGEDTDSDSAEGAAAPAPLLAAAAPMPAALGAASGHSHCVCGASHSSIGDHTTQSAQTWTETTSLPIGSGHYYLTADVTISNTWTMSAGDVHLCLNGHTITMSGDGPVIKVSSGASITLTDCTGTPGEITHNDKPGCGVYVDGTGTFKMFGGNITGNRDNDKDTEPGGGVYVAPSGTFNMYGGKITGNRGTYYYYDVNTRVGGGVYVAIKDSAAGTFNMYGGIIGGTGKDDGNTADKGGGVYLEQANLNEAGATFNMSGGKIIGNKADQGGGVYAGGESEFTMTGGSITNNEATGDNTTYAGGGVYVNTDSITVGGGAQITGNKSVGITNEGKDDNVYLYGYASTLNVNNGFAGSVGINAGATYWENNRNTAFVTGDGRSSAIGNNKITYDNGEFEIKGDGKLGCLHTGGLSPTSQAPYHCSICNEVVVVQTDFQNAAGITTKTQHYTDAKTAFEKAENNCVITLLTNATFNDTWDLDGKTVTLYANYTLNNLAVKDGTLNLKYTGSTTLERIPNMAVENNATVNVDVTSYTKFGSLTVKSGGKVLFKSGKVDALSVESGGKMEITGGTFGSISVAEENTTCLDLLANGYAYFDKTANAIKAGNTKNLSDVTIVAHTCDFDNKPTCDCGRECPHSSIDFNTGKCSTCGATLNILVQNATGTRNFTSFNDAMDSIQPGDTDVTIKLMEDATFEDTDGGEETTTQFTVPCTLDLNGKTLTVKEKKRISGQNQTVDGGLEIESTVTIKGAGTLNAASVDVYSGSSLTVEGNVNFQTLNVNNGATVQLKGGKYDKIVVRSGKCLDLLADGYAYFKAENTLTSGKANTLENVTVGEHSSCTFNEENSGICPCGRECAHSDIDTTTHKCTVCDTPMAAKVTKGGTDSYYTTFNAALEGVRGAKNTDDAKLTLLEDTNLSADATLPGGVYIIELNGKTLGNSTGNSYVLTADSNGAATIQDTVGGKIDCTLKCTVAGHSSLKITGGTFARLEMAVGPTNGTGWPQISGGKFDEIVRTSDRACRVINLLAWGSALEKNGATSDKYYPANTEIPVATAPITNVTVVSCTCESSASCNYCGKNSPVELTLYGENDAVLSCNYYTSVDGATSAITEAEDNTSTAVTRATIRLLSNVTPIGNFTYNGAVPLTLDLNGKNLNSPITVNTTSSLTITGDDGQVGAGSNDKVTVTKGTLYVSGGNFIGGLDVSENGNVVLSGGTFGLHDASITVAGEGKTVGGLLAEGYGYWCNRSSGSSWATATHLSQTTLTLEKTQGASAVTVQELPGVSVSASPASVAYGSTATLTATVSGVEAGKTITYQWYKVEDSSMTTITDETESTYTTPDTLAVGTYTFTCEATVDGYAMTSNQVTVTVTKATLTEQTGSSGSEGGSGSASTAIYTAPKANTLTFTTQNIGGSNPEAVAQALVNAPTLPTGCTAYYKVGDGGWTDDVTKVTGTNAGEYTVYWYITGSANYNDVGSEETPAGSVEVTIAPMTVAKDVPTLNPNGIQQLYIEHWNSQNGIWCSDGVLTYTYTGSLIRPTFRLRDVNEVVIPASGYGYSITNNENAGDGIITVWDTDPNDNFKIKKSEFEFAIKPKTVTLSPDTYTHYAVSGGSITFELTDIAKALGMPAGDGELTFLLASSPAPTGGMSISENGDVSIASPTAQTYTAKVLVWSNNHQGSFTLNVEVSDSKTTPTIDVNNFTKDYDGAVVTVDAVTQSATATVNGTNIAGTWSWTKTGTAPKTVTDSGYYLLTFTPSDDNYTSVTKAVQVTINAKDIGGDGITATAADYTYTGQPISPTLTVKHGETTLTRNTDYYYAAGISATDAGSHTLQITGKGNYTGTRQVTWTIAPKTLTASGLTAQKEYDGTAAVNTNTMFSLTLSESLTLNTDYQITAVAFDSADAGTRTVTATVKLLNENYCFSVGTDGTPVREQEITGNGYIAPIVLDTPPTVKADVVRIRQDVSVPDGSYPLVDNVALTAQDGWSLDALSRELRFALGDLPAKVTAEIDEITGMLTYTISGGRSGEKFAIPVTLTMPNFTKQSGAAAVALFALNDQAQEVDPDAGTITLGFTVEIELTGGGHEHIRRQPISTTTGGGSGSTGGNGSASGSSVASPDTGDAGIALYGVLTVLSLTGGAWIRRRKF